MLESLDNLDWYEVSDAFGPATRVPGFLRALASPDPDIRASALENLTNHIWHQTALYDATAAAVPFLIELLAAEQVADKHLLLGLLWGISGAGAKPIHPPYADPAGTQPAGDIARRIYSEAREGIDVYLPFLENPHIQLRGAASYLLSLFSEDTPRLAPYLLAVARDEQDPPARAEMVSSLGLLLAGGKDRLGQELAPYLSFLEGLLDPPEENAVRLAAATAITPLTLEHTPDKVVNLLLDAIGRPDDYSRFFTPLAVPGEAARALAYIDRERGITALSQGLLRSSAYTSAHDIIEQMLDLAFKGKQAHNYARTYRTAKDGTNEIWYTQRSTFRKEGAGLTAFIPEPIPVVPAESLSPEEKIAVNAAVNSEIAWIYRTNLYELYGLPSDREGLRRLLSSTE